MCGIAGFVNAGCEEHLAKMADLISHRGPDDSGTYFRSYGDTLVGLAARRLAILDLSAAGHMPMTTRDGRYSLVYNGEVYNFSAIRKDLESAGHQFSSSSDTEVVLNAYVEYGDDCVRRFNGMFAFAIWDRDARTLLIARDQLGIKPLYYASWPGNLAFASEVKSLLVLPGLSRGLDVRALHQYLTFLWVPDPLTMFAGIRKLPAGHYGKFKDGELTLTKYWDVVIPDVGHAFSSDSENIKEELKVRWNRSVASQLVSDVPFGAFLSAGIDSTSIVAAMHGAGVSSPRTFTISFSAKENIGEVTHDDTAVAARTAKRFGCKHTNIVVNPDVAGLLPKVVWHMDEPVADPAAIMAYLISREARKSVTVLLSGVGGDELFAGYRKHQAHFWALTYQKIPSMLRRNLIEPFVKQLPTFRGTPLKGYVRLAKKMATSGSLPPVERFLTDSVYFSEGQKVLLYSADLRNSTAGYDPFATHLEHLSHVAHADFLNQMLYLDLKTFMVSLNLTYNDKMSMASSVEVRVPFLDVELVEWVFRTVDPKLKLRSGTGKFIFREALASSIPGDVLRQKKAGFGAPIDSWLVNDLREMTSDLLSESRIKMRGLFRPYTIREMLKQHRTGAHDWSLQIWQLLTLELWMQEFIDKH